MTAWQLYFCSLVSMSLHPGYTRPETHKPTIRECARMADEMAVYQSPHEDSH